MEFWLIFTATLVVITQFISGYSLRDSALHQPARACGHKLAEVLSLVCKHGYYQYFSSSDSSSDRYRSDKRYKRGIVDECCHSGCSYHTLEQYCIPPTTEAPGNSQIRKRSDTDEEWRKLGSKETSQNAQSLYPNFHHHRYNYLGRHNLDGEENKVEPESNGQAVLRNSILPKLDVGDGRKGAYSEEVTDRPSRENIVSMENSSKGFGRTLMDKIKNGIEDRQINPDLNDDQRPILVIHPNGRWQRKWPSESTHTEKLRHNERHLNHLTTDDNNRQEEDPSSDEKRQENRSVISRVGIENPYFLAKESVHPKVKPAINFSVRRHMSQKR